MKIFKPLSDFVLEQDVPGLHYLTAMDTCIRYAKFLKQENHIGLYIPCDEDGNVFEEPKTPWQDFIMHEGIHEKYHIKLKEFQIAKEKVLFEGFYLEKGKFDTNNQTTYLLHSELDLCVAFKKDWEDHWDFETDLEEVAKFNAVELTEGAVKQIYGL